MKAYEFLFGINYILISRRTHLLYELKLYYFVSTIVFLIVNIHHCLAHDICDTISNWVLVMSDKNLTERQQDKVYVANVWLFLLSIQK